MLRTVCLSALCAGLFGQVYATDYEYVYEGPVTIALTITRQLPDSVVQNGETTITTWKTQTTKFTNKEYIKIIADYLVLSIDIAKTKLMVRDEGVLFIRSGNEDYDVPAELSVLIDQTAGAYSGKETVTGLSETITETGRELLSVQLLDMQLSGISAYKGSWSWKETETGSSESLSDSGSAKVSGTNDNLDVIEGTITYALKTVKMAIPAP